MTRDRLHRRQTRGARPSEQVQQKGLNPIVAIVRERNLIKTNVSNEIGKHVAPQLTSVRLKVALLGQDLDSLRIAWHSEVVTKTLDKRFVAIRFRGSKTMI